MRFRRCLFMLLACVVMWGLPPAVMAQGQLIAGSRTLSGSLNYGHATGAANTYVLTLAPSINPTGTATYTDGLCVTAQINVANTGAATLNVNGMGARALKKRVLGVAQDLASTDLGVGQDMTACIDNATSTWQVMSLGGGSGGGSGNVSTSGTPVAGQVAIWTSLTAIQGQTILPATAFPQLTGDVTTVAGALGTTVTNLPSGVTQAGTLLATAIAAPGTNPAPGKAFLYLDTLTKRLSAKNDVGAISTTVSDIDCTGIGHILKITAGLSQCTADSGVAGGLGDPGSNGLLARTGLNITGARTLTGTPNGIVVTNGDGVAGNPTFALSPNPLFGGINAQVGTSYTVQASDQRKLVTFNNAAPVAVTMPDATVPGFTAGALFAVRNLGAGLVTIIRSTTSTLDGATSLLLAPATAATIWSDGSNYSTQRTFANPMQTGGDFIYGGASGSASRLPAGAGLLRGNGAGVAPSIAELSGDITTTDSNVATLGNNVVTYAKIQQVSATSRVLGRATAGAGLIEELTPATAKTMLGLTFADLTGVATDAQIADLNVYSTGLTASRCVETDGTGKLSIAAGTCGVSGGTTGISAATNHGLMVATGGTTGSSLGVATNGQLAIGATGADPVLGTITGAVNQIRVTLGPGTIALDFPPGGLTLPGVTSGSFSGSLSGNASSATTAGALSSVLGCAQHPALAGDVTNLAGNCTVTVQPNAITYAKMQDVSAPAVLLGRGAGAGSGDPQEIALGAGLSMTGTTLNASTAGDVLSVGNCLTGACLDGTAAGGSSFALFGGGVSKGTFQTVSLSGDRIYTFPNVSGDVCLANNACSGYQASLGFTAVPTTRLVNGHALSSDVLVTKADVGLDQVDNSSNATERVAVASLANKQIIPRTVFLTGASCPITPLGACTGTLTAPSADSADIYIRYDITGPITIPNPTAIAPNPVHGQVLKFKLRSATPQVITWGANFNTENGVPLLGSTTGDTNCGLPICYDIVAYEYNTNSFKWAALASTKSTRGVVGITTSTAPYTLNVNADSASIAELQHTGVATTITIAAPTGAAIVNGQQLRLRLMCTVAQTLAFATGTGAFVGSPNVPVPTSCPLGTSSWFMIGAEYSSALSRWQIIATN